MAKMFALILALATLIHGIIWCFVRLKLALERWDKTSGSNVGHNKLVAAIKKPLPSWLEASASVFPVLLLVFVVRSFFYEPFQIPSGSMMPTLLIGDFILVNKYAYGIKNPITQTTLINVGHPKRGDIAVFKYPLNAKLDYIKRVIGLPGDRIIYDSINKRVTIKSFCDNAQYCDKIDVITYNGFQPSDFIQLFSRSRISPVSNIFDQIPPSDNVPRHGARLYLSQEVLGDITHSILTLPGTRDRVSTYYQQPGEALAEWIVPTGCYFMMGDNRDNSADSRYWGFVPEKNLVGKATIIWISFKKQEGEWPNGFRLSRIGAIH
ncbi:signal peptidase I [Serratia symbiotica str. 'Cinara cedri']|nr:signal peptidase I [Serratia symbiotica str. 'Cinara cedri']